MNEFINSARVKKLALGLCEKRGGKLTRVSKEFLDCVNDEVRRYVQNAVMTAPTIGKTLFPAIRPAKVKEES